MSLPTPFLAILFRINRPAPTLRSYLIAAAMLLPSGSPAAILYVSEGGYNTLRAYETTSGAGNEFASTNLNGQVLTLPRGIAFDSAGNLYVATNNTNSIECFTPGGAGSVFANTGLNQPEALAFDSAGNLYVANIGDNTIVKFTPDGTGSLFANTGLSSPVGMAFDRAGNLFVANSGNDTIEKFTPDGTGTLFAFTGDGSGPAGLAFDKSGNLYVSCFYLNKIEKFTASGSGSVFAQDLKGVVLNQPLGMVFDPLGNLYVANQGGNTIEKFTPGKAASVFAGFDGQNSPSFMALTDDQGNPLLPVSIINPFPPFAGTYQGLIASGTPLRDCFYTLTLGPTGALTLALKTASGSYSAKGILDQKGVGTVIVPRKNQTSLTINLYLNFGVSFTLTLDDASDGGALSGSLEKLAGYSSKVPAPEAGKYTLLFLPPSDVNLPQGIGWATLNVSPAGVVAATGKLGDGTPFTLGSRLLLSGGNQKRFLSYSSLYKTPTGRVYGNFLFEDLPGISDFDATFYWWKPAQSAQQLFQGGFSTSIDAIGSAYVAPVAGQFVLGFSQGASNGIATLSGGDLSAEIDKTLSVSPAPSNAVSVVNPGTDKFKLTLSGRTGKMSGSFVPVAGKAATVFGGVLFQKQNLGAGCFLGGSQTGTVLFEPY